MSPASDSAQPLAAGPLRDIRQARIAAALIDLDGTMVDTARDFCAALNAMLTRLGARPIELTEVLTYIGKGSEHLIGAVLAPRFAQAQAQALFQQAFDTYQAEYARINGQFSSLYPQVEAGLAAMRSADIKLACVTNKPRRFALELLRHYGLLDYFSVVYGGDSWPQKKPHPQPMLEACRALAVAPAHAVAIGDSENDALAARAAGLWSLAVPYGYNHGQSVQKIPADGIVENLLQAAQLIAQRS
jgi:phosphoglycolate phosphatase